MNVFCVYYDGIKIELCMTQFRRWIETLKKVFLS